MSFCRNANMAPVMKVGRYVKYVRQSFIVWFRSLWTENKFDRAQSVLYILSACVELKIGVE
ncbi:hypothetical protein Avbf_11051 [Armadillidium vulgare]|nr:hypothetical protein Avbf_11051 [Armadillidium vulgare]